MVFPIGLRRADPARREELHPLAVEPTDLSRLVPERIAEDAHHRFGAQERGRRIDVDPPGVSHVAPEERPALGEDAHAVRQ
jgi:hypothetical protein